jgi:predicted  nucleic acid-binding Zn-ribbon protein
MKNELINELKAQLASANEKLANATKHERREWLRIYIAATENRLRDLGEKI